MRLPSGTVTFLFTDIEGSTKLWEQHPTEMHTALARHDALLHETIQMHGGQVFKTVGDAFCTAFSTATDGLAAALAVQQALHAETWDDEIGMLHVRMALHTGAAEERDNDYFGSSVNRVARLLAIGYGGQVLLSEATTTLVRDRLTDGCGLRDMSLHRLKDLQQPEYVWQLLHPDLPADFPPLRSLQAFTHNLPVQPTSFIGREPEMAEVKRLLDTTCLLTLTGAGGCGKTRLALQIAAEVIEAYSDGVWLVELASLSDGSLVPQKLAAALRLREEPGRPVMETLANHLQPKSLLLILDNCEHLVEACAQLADTLLHSCPQVKILATSREALNIAGETTYRVPSLVQPDPKILPVAEKELVSVLAEYDAVRLFVERARAHRSDFALHRQNGPAVAEVCSRLDGIPLAIELAAARVRAMTVPQIASRLDDRFQLLTGGNRMALPKQQTLRATLDWSYDLLSEPERVLLCRLSVFVGGWSLGAAEQICSGEGIEVEAVLDLLTSLLDKSLVLFEEQEGEAGGRYHLLETIRHYAQERLAETEEGRHLRSQHLNFCLTLAEEAEAYLTSAEQGAWMDRLETEHDNLSRAMATCQAIGEAGGESALRLCGALWRFWAVRGHLSEGREWIAAALSQTGSEEQTPWRAKAFTGAGILAYSQGDYAAAWAYHEEGLAIQQILKDSWGIAASLNNLGNVAADQGDYASAQACYKQSLALRREIGDRGGIADTLNNLGIVAFDQGNYTAARVCYEQSLTIRREIGDRQGIATSLNNLGNVAYSQGDYVSAQVYHEESLAIRREIGDQRGIATSLVNLGNVASAQSDPTAARTYYEESLSIHRAIEDRNGIANSLINLGDVAREQRDYALARSFYEQSLSIQQEIGNLLGITYLLESFAALASAQERPEQAARLWGAAEALREEIGSLLPPSERSEYDRMIAETQAKPSEEAFAAGWAEGRMMTLEQAIACALLEG